MLHCDPDTPGCGKGKGEPRQGLAHRSLPAPRFHSSGTNQLLRSADLLKHKLILVSGHSPGAVDGTRGHRARIGGAHPIPTPQVLSLSPARCKSGTVGDTGWEGRALETLLQSEGKAGWMEKESRDSAGKWGEREKYCQKQPKCLEI